jgi:hypothetical protein
MDCAGSWAVRILPSHPRGHSVGAPDGSTIRDTAVNRWTKGPNCAKLTSGARDLRWEAGVACT